MTLFVETGCPICLEAETLVAEVPVNVEVLDIGTVDGLAAFYNLSPDSDALPLLVTDGGMQLNGSAALAELRRMSRPPKGGTPNRTVNGEP